MVFSSIIFLFVFLPLVLLFYYAVPVRLKNYILLIFSFIFYAWSEPKAFFIMLAVIAINYVFAILIQERSSLKKLFLFIDILVCLSFLFYFKYFDFSITLLNRIFHKNISLINIALPIGISFYIFQSISYAVDVFRGQCKVQKNFFKLALYVSFFPQLIAGPIVKYYEIEKQINKRQIDFEFFVYGVRRFILGLAKKVLIANSAAALVDSVFLRDFEIQGLQSYVLWIGIISYAIQIYFDFSGYSDMAIGLGKMFGFSFAENFNYPYISFSVTEFWRRWHISLSTWFKEYVYIPLGGNRVSKTRTLFNIAIVFLLTGIWHGAALTFVAWGIFHAFFNVLEKIFNLTKPSKKLFIRFIQHIYLLLVVLLGWVIFRSPSLKYSLIYIFRMFGITKINDLFFQTFSFHPLHIIMVILGIIFSVPILPKLQLKMENLCLQNAKTEVVLTVVKNTSCLLLLFLCIIRLSGGTYNPFIYFRF